MEIQFNDISYKLNADGTASVCEQERHIQGDVNIPNTITYQERRYKVTSIGWQAFHDCTGLTSITIPNSVWSIRDSAFQGCTGLTSIIIPNSVTRIESSAFSGCTGLTSITIPNSVTSIESSAFQGCTGLTSITIPNSITSIRMWAFKGCIGLTEITIPDSVMSIGKHSLTIFQDFPNEDAFSECEGISKIQVSKNNPTYDSRENCNAIIETATNSLIKGCCTTIIPDSVTNIGDSAFKGCTGLTEITIPNSVTSIEDSAFKGCTGLTSITIPNSVTSIGDSAFKDCTGLTSITIPDSVTSIGNSAFKGCTKLSTINMLNNVTFIGISAFRGCYELTELIIPKVEGIGYNAFASSGLISITLGNKLTYFEQFYPDYDCADLFEECENLQIIRVPKGKKEDYCQLGLGCDELIQEPQEEEYTILLNIARGYERGIGMAKNLAQAVLCYVQAVDKGCSEAAFHLGELYETGNGLPQDLKQAAEWYAKAAALYHPTAESKRRACLQKLQQEERERAKQVAESAKAKYLFFDTETNGLPYDYKAGIDKTNNWPHLLQLGWIMTDEQGNVLKSRTKWRYPNGFSVDSEVTELTRITTDQLRRDGEDISSILREFMQDAENAEILVGHNIEYDMMVIGCELYRNGQPTQGQALTRHPHICTMKQTVNFCAIPSTNSYYSDYKYPELTELYTKLFGHAFSGAHDAMADSKATKECFFELKRRGVL